jgi:protein SCO1/2
MNDAPRIAAPLRRALLVVLAGLAAALGGGYAARHFLARQAAAPLTEVAAVYGAPRPLPEFSLVAHDGTRFDRGRFAGHWTLVYFGFTNCPDACPTTLTALALVRRDLANLPRAQLPQVVMVSVDPERDTPARLAAYVPHFDPSFIGVTGTPAAIEALTRALGVAVQAGPVVDGAYTVDHTAAVFLIDPEVRVAAIFPTPHVPRTVAGDYRQIVAARGRG